jgi:DNA-directed RNA polymerase alpha subunit
MTAMNLKKIVMKITSATTPTATNTGAQFAVRMSAVRVHAGLNVVEPRATIANATTVLPAKR